MASMHGLRSILQTTSRPVLLEIQTSNQIQSYGIHQRLCNSDLLPPLSWQYHHRPPYNPIDLAFYSPHINPPGFQPGEIHRISTIQERRIDRIDNGISHSPAERVPHFPLLSDCIPHRRTPEA